MCVDNHLCLLPTLLESSYTERIGGFSEDGFVDYKAASVARGRVQ